MDVSIFKNLHSARPQQTSLEKIIEMIRTSHKLEEMTLEARAFYAAGEKEKGDVIKKTKLPAFAPCATLIDGKGRYNLIGLTGLCFIDIDKVDIEQVDAAMDTLRNDEHVLLAARSISGHGLHILVPYTLSREDPDTSLPATPAKANQVYGSVFKAAAARYSELLQLSIDYMAANAERLCVVSYDRRAHYNPTAVPIVYKYEHQKSGKKPKRFNEK